MRSDEFPWRSYRILSFAASIVSFAAALISTISFLTGASLKQLSSWDTNGIVTWYRATIQMRLVAIADALLGGVDSFYSHNQGRFVDLIFTVTGTVIGGLILNSLLRSKK